MTSLRTPASLTDLYQLTMLQAYFRAVMNETAVFELFVRSLTQQRNFFIAAGLEQALDYLENLCFTDEELRWLESRGFQRDFIASLSRLRFSGNVDAMAEGTLFFPSEPIIRIIAPLPQAQLVESRLINLLQFQCLIASKAVRTVLASRGQTLVEFGARRAHGAEAALLAARASYLAGFHGTANVHAGMLFGIDTFGTMAHSFIQMHSDEKTAFLAFARANPGNVILLIDTYNTERGAQRVVKVASQLRTEGIRIRGVRIDSGDLAEHAKAVRAILDAGGLAETQIFVSGDLDEWKVRNLLAAAAPINGFGIGTRMDVSADLPYLNCAYKLQEYAGVPKRKRSEGKATWPGRKQVFRTYRQGEIVGDIIALEGDQQPGEPLLQRVMQAGRRVVPAEPLPQIRDRTLANVAQLPAALRGLEKAPDYPVAISASVRQLAEQVDQMTGP